jgi:hypothetical protein
MSLQVVGGALSGAASGASKCLQLRDGGIKGGSGIAGIAAGIQALLVVACLPFGAAIGAATSSNTAKSASSEKIRSAEDQMGSASKTLELPRVLAQAMARYAELTGLQGAEQLDGEGPVSLEAQPQYRPGPDYVVEITLLDLKATTPGSEDLRYRFLLRARGRLVRVAGNVVLDQFSFVAATREATVDQWTAEDGKVASAAFKDASLTVAEAFIDEWILMYRGDSKDKAPTSMQWRAPAPATPDYVIRPIYPPKPAARSRRAVPVFPAGVPSSVDSTTPALSWEKLPRSIAGEYFSGIAPRARNLVYDVRIFNAGVIHRQVPMGGTVPVIIPANLIRIYRDLPAATVQVTQALPPCAHYFWTVRARFELDGRQRSTEWSFHAMDLDPSWDRRSSRPFFVLLPIHAAYYPFKTGALEGERCGEPRFVKLAS